jgi:hypothetical protein
MNRDRREKRVVMRNRRRVVADSGTVNEYLPAKYTVATRINAKKICFILYVKPEWCFEK